jgi:hypothetical protein
VHYGLFTERIVRVAETVLYVNIMHESLLRKEKYLKEILSLTLKQGELAKAEKFDEDAFGKLVDEKEILINNVNEIDKGFTSVYDRVRSEILKNKDAYRDSLLEIQDDIRRCVDLGMQIEATESRNQSEMEQVFATRYRGIRQMKQSKSIANKYYKSMSNGMINDSILYDRKK